MNSPLLHFNVETLDFRISNSLQFPKIQHGDSTEENIHKMRFKKVTSDHIPEIIFT
jgi:hypothetical protein